MTSDEVPISGVAVKQNQRLELSRFEKTFTTKDENNCHKGRNACMSLFPLSPSLNVYQEMGAGISQAKALSSP